MKTKTYSLDLPVPTIDVKKVFQEVIYFIKRVGGWINNQLLRFIRKIKASKIPSFRSNTPSVEFEKPKFKTPSFRKYLRAGIYVVIVLLLVVLASRLFRVTDSEVADSRTQVMGAKATVEVNKRFEFPLINGDGEEVEKIYFEIVNAEKRDEIVVQGKKATAVKGRTFLILNLKITNEYDQAIEINAKDYIRLTVNGNEEEWLAPDIHNDPVLIQAISTKITRVGFPISDDVTDLVLQVGEIGGEKEKISLEF